MADDNKQEPQARDGAAGDRDETPPPGVDAATGKTEKPVDDADKDIAYTDNDVDKSRICPAVTRAFALGWGLVELRGRIQAERGEVEQRGMRVASLWRVSLSKIALIHAQVFPLISTDLTFYAPQDTLPKYLFPAPERDYTQFSLLDPRDDKDVKLASFKLYDVTRRAINCLALLYVDPNDSLDSDRIKGLQEALENAVRDEALAAAKPKDQLTALVRKFLDAWDGFLREHYFAGGMLPGNDLESIAYEAGRSMALLSWNITSETLEWERSLQHLCGHKPVPEGNKDVLETRRAAIEATVSKDRVRHAWEHAFRQDFIIRLQHDVVALSAKLDEAHRAKKEAAGAAAASGDPDVELPSVSIRAIKEGLEFWRRAVMKTLAAVPKQATPAAKKPADAGDSAEDVKQPDAQELAKAGDDTDIDAADIEAYATRYAWSPAMRLALTKQVNIWQTLISGQQSLRAFSTESVAQKLVNEVWEEIQGGLSADIGLAVQRAQSAAVTLGKDAGVAIEDVARAARSFLLPMGIFVLLILLACALLFFNRPGAEAAAPVGMAGMWAAGAAIYKWFGFSRFADATKNKLNEKAADTAKAATDEGSEGSGLAQRLGNFTHSIAADALSAMRSGFAQAQTELDDLNRSVSVAYPLVDYIALERSRVSEGGSAAAAGPASGSVFLKDIIWTSEERAEEIKAVVRAALGPVALLAYSAAQTSKHPSGAPAVSVQTDGHGRGPDPRPALSWWSRPFRRGSEAPEVRSPNEDSRAVR